MDTHLAHRFRNLKIQKSESLGSLMSERKGKLELAKEEIRGHNGVRERRKNRRGCEKEKSEQERKSFSKNERFRKRKRKQRQKRNEKRSERQRKRRW